ncbi:LysR family transcriptional regulator [Variovorax sp. AFSI2.2]|uniref:LysR family transcriptional regulator n=1 Tax=Variovorax sp. AFSI2.2 TaxID=3384160 RepID=UPI003EB9F8AB
MHNQRILTIRSKNMNLKSLRYFCEVVETESANLAATRLHVVSAAVSMQIA